MIGIELKFRNKTLQLPLETVCIITRKNDKHGERMYLSVGMYDPSTNESIRWVQEDLYLGDLVEITKTKIDQISEPKERVNFDEIMKKTDEESKRDVLERFAVLKQELEDEGIL